MLEPGDKAPDFKLEGDDGKTHTLKEFSGKTLILYFYPKDNTPGCTTEGAQFRDLHVRFAKAGAVVAGISRDSIKSHQNFATKMGFPFPLLSDADEKLCQQFDVIKMKNMYGKKVRGIERSTFLIDADGNLAAIKRRVKPDEHTAWALGEVEKLTAGATS